MKRILVLALIAGGLVAGQASVPSTATAAVTKTVSIRATESNTLSGNNVCSGKFGFSPVAAQYSVVGNGNPPLGNQYLGYTTPQNEVAHGPKLNVLNEPVDDITSLSFQAKSAGGLQGVLRIFYYDADRKGYWVGVKNFTRSGDAWQAVGLNGTVFTNWTHRKMGTSTITAAPGGATTFSGSVKQLSAAYPGKLAEIDILVGCDGGTTYLDNIRVSDGTDTITWDLEGYPPVMRFSGYTGSAVNQWKTGLSTYTMRGPKFREYIWASVADPEGALQRAPLTIQVLSGKRWVTLKSINPTNGYVRLNDAYESRKLPDVQTQYRFCTPGAGEVDNGCSSSLTVRVPFAVGTSAAKVVRQGAKVVVNTSVTPSVGAKAAGVKATLQRWDNRGNRWITLKTGRTNSVGKVNLAATATSAGVSWKLRVLVDGTSRNLSKASKDFLVKLEKKPSKKGPKPTVSTSSTAGQGDTKAATPGF